MTEHSKPNPADQRSDVKNPNNPAHKDANDNTSRQRNPQDPKHHPKQEAPQNPNKKT